MWKVADDRLKLMLVLEDPKSLVQMLILRLLAGRGGSFKRAFTS